MVRSCKSPMAHTLRRRRVTTWNMRLHCRVMESSARNVGQHTCSVDSDSMYVRCYTEHVFGFLPVSPCRLGRPNSLQWERCMFKAVGSHFSVLLYHRLDANWQELFLTKPSGRRIPIIYDEDRLTMYMFNQIKERLGSNDHHLQNMLVPTQPKTDGVLQGYVPWCCNTCLSAGNIIYYVCKMWFLARKFVHVKIHFHLVSHIDISAR